MKVQFFGAAIALLGLTACGGATTSGLEGPFMAISAASEAVGTPPTADNSQGSLPTTITLNANGSDHVLNRNETLDLEDFASYQTNSIGSIHMTNRSDFSQVSVSYLQAAPDPSVGVTFGAVTGDNAIAASGSATYTGDYAAVIENGGFILQRVAGDVSLTADFDTSLLNGTITNREFFGSSSATAFGLTVTDVDLDGLSMDANGRITGTITGGELDDPSWGAASGTADLAVTGPEAEEIVGAVTLDQTIGGTGYVERGGLLVSR